MPVVLQGLTAEIVYAEQLGHWRAFLDLESEGVDTGTHSEVQTEALSVVMNLREEQFRTLSSATWVSGKERFHCGCGDFLWGVIMVFWWSRDCRSEFGPQKPFQLQVEPAGFRVHR